MEVLSNLMVYDLSDRRCCSDWVSGVAGRGKQAVNLRKELRDLVNRSFENHRIGGLVAARNGQRVDITVLLNADSWRSESDVWTEIECLGKTPEVSHFSREGIGTIGFHMLDLPVKSLFELAKKALYSPNVSIQAAFFHRPNEAVDIDYTRRLFKP